MLDRIAEERGHYLKKLRMDNGPEFIGPPLAVRAEAHGVNLEFIQPGKPTQNSYVERFNKTYRTEVLDLFVFNSLDEVREATEEFVREYNEERPHESLGDMPPTEFAARRAGGTPCPPATPKPPTQSLYSSLALEQGTLQLLRWAVAELLDIALSPRQAVAERHGGELRRQVASACLWSGLGIDRKRRQLLKVAAAL